MDQVPSNEPSVASDQPEDVVEEKEEALSSSREGASAIRKAWRTWRDDHPFLAAVVASVLAGMLLLLPSGIFGREGEVPSETPAGRTDPSEDETGRIRSSASAPSATQGHGRAFSVRIARPGASSYVVADPPEAVPRAPRDKDCFSTRRDAWIRRLDAVPANEMFVVVTVTAHTEEPVLVQSLDVETARRIRPVNGTTISQCPPASAAESPVRRMIIDLDASPPSVEYTDPRRKPTGTFLFTVTSRKPELFLLEASSLMHAYRWTATMTLRIGDRRIRRRLTGHDGPFTLTPSGPVLFVPNCEGDLVPYPQILNECN